jgi:tyrosyl-tRNA synthetase
MGDGLFAKRLFGGELVSRYHSADAAAAAVRTFQATYLGDGVPDEVAEIEVSTEGKTLLLAKALCVAALVPSTSEGRRLITQGGVEVDGERVSDGQHQLARGRSYLVRVGSKRRKFCRIRVP